MWFSLILLSNYVPDPIKNPDLFKLLTTYQVHSHSKSYRKYKNEKCRYHFGKFFTDYTIISILLDGNLPEDVRNSNLNERDRILGNVKEYISNNLNPKKRNILNPLKENYEKVPNIPDILKGFNLTEDQYCDALSISNDSYFQIYLKRQPMHVLLIIFLKKVCKHGRQTLTDSQSLNTIKLLLICVLTFLKLRLKHQRL